MNKFLIRKSHILQDLSKRTRVHLKKKQSSFGSSVMKDLINIIIMIKMKKIIYKEVIVNLFNTNLNDPPKKYSWSHHYPQGWISTARSTLFATKEYWLLRPVHCDLWLRHQSYHFVDLKPIYSTLPKSSPSNHSHAATTYYTLIIPN